MSLEVKQPVIIRKIRKTRHGAHGGAWKVAYADFVTAMMAFFLLLWLLGSTTEAQKKGIAEYFENPYRVSLSGGETSGDTTSVLQGGGPDISQDFGQINLGDSERVVDRKHAGESDVQRDHPELNDRALLEALNRDLRQAIENQPLLREFRDQLKIDFTRDGLRIQLVDQKRRPMFALGSDRLKPYAERILAQLTPLIAAMPNRIIIIGHTDAKPYAAGNRKYGNWELSAGRANAARRAMLSAGLPEDMVVRVSGMAAELPFDAEHPRAPVNRRIAIIVLNKRAQRALLNAAGGGIALELGAPPGEELIAPEQTADTQRISMGGPLSELTSGG